MPRSGNGSSATRLSPRPSPGGCGTWACVDAFDDAVFGDHVGTDGRTPAKIAALILVMIGRA
jgi:hypothetical protein